MKYDEKVDIWGIGVVAHIALCGSPPFNGERFEDVSRSILNDEPKFGKVKNKLSYEAKNFTSKCLNKDPSKRPSAASLLKHPWLSRHV